MSLISAQFYHMPGRYERVIERSRDVTPRLKREKSKGCPRSPCAINMVQFRPLFPELQDFEKMAHAIFF